MKKQYKIFLPCILFLTLLFGLTSCQKYLNKTADSTVQGDDAYKNFTNFQGFTEELYQCIPDFTNAYWTNSWNWGEDEIISTSNNFHFVNKIDLGDFWGWQSEFDGWQAGWMDRANSSTNSDRFSKSLWPLAWYGIHKANLGLANMDKLTDATDEERNLIKGQLLFFRGWFHFELIQYFGGLPYIDTLLPSDKQLTLPRLSYKECADKAAADFQAAADLLPINWDNTTAGKNTLGKNQLRINKIMALSYLGKNYLWAGSPLMNFSSTGSETYNADYCKKAAQAFAQVLQLCESGAAPYSLLPFSKYSDNFYTTGQNWLMPGGTEAIFRGPYYGGNSSNWGTSKQYTPSIVGEGTLIFVPTANYVDYYGMANGLPIADITKPDPVSGYDPEYPWKGRDPRFYNDIVYDGVKVVQGSTTDEANRYANLYADGTTAGLGSYRDLSTGSRTGYLLKKFIPITCNKYDNGYDYSKSLNIHIPYMRLADVYLMYAEAVAEGYGSPSSSVAGYGKTAIDAVNVIRDRAGAGHVAPEFQGSLDAFMPELRRERAVELSFEGHRFNDLRRWMLLIKRPYTLKTAVFFNRAGTFNTTDPTQNRVQNLREQVILERNFTQKHYWLPLKNSDVTLYPGFNQNPGW
ncbi:RagB/SusD family nutrient uptake outer membrane protein [Arachidicoccus sp.]|uniref:RagB/SusD family nutrient uptake outer membrane protein n=1 Tax=Arachidicoccus sp. TaxID=1872624 RepID=UPI003D23C0EB